MSEMRKTSTRNEFFFSVKKCYYVCVYLSVFTCNTMIRYYNGYFIHLFHLFRIFFKSFFFHYLFLYNFFSSLKVLSYDSPFLYVFLGCCLLLMLLNRFESVISFIHNFQVYFCFATLRINTMVLCCADRSI